MANILPMAVLSTTFMTGLASPAAGLPLVCRGFSSIERRLEVIEGDLKQSLKDRQK